MKFEDAFLRFSIAIVVLICDKVVSSDGYVPRLDVLVLEITYRSPDFLKLHFPVNTTYPSC